LYTDFVCPFCFVAEESTVPRLLADFELELDWYGFELHPTTPRGGLPLQALFPGANLPLLHERTRRFGADFGVAAFTPPDRLQNTRRALAVADYARQKGLLAAFRRAAFDAHWRHGNTLESDDDLREIVRSVQMDADEALIHADDPETLRRVDERQQAARTAGISGVPTFEIAARRVVGCQPYPVLAALAEQAGVPRRPGGGKPAS
jgi:predicted DsbA family dithiol-disulfide isomerase